MLALRQAHAATERTLADERLRLARALAELDREIDQQVYTLYGLSQTEIAAVEEGRKEEGSRKKQKQKAESSKQ